MKDSVKDFSTRYQAGCSCDDRPVTALRIFVPGGSVRSFFGILPTSGGR